MFRGVRIVSSMDDLLADEGLDAVVLATPPSAHYEGARTVLQADKHLLVRPPLALGHAEAVELARDAESRRRRMTVAYRLPFSPAVRKLRELLDRGALGELYYIDLTQHDPGARRRARNVLWCLGTEQVALIAQLLVDEPVELTARGESYTEPGIVEVAHCELRFATGVWARMHLSWLGPEQTYRLTVIGAERTAVIDRNRHGFELRIHQGEGDVVLPRLSRDEPLRLACEHFLRSLSSRSYSFAATREGARVVGVLETLQVSMDHAGAAETLGAREDATIVPIRGSVA